MSFKVDQYTYDESEGQADVVVVLKGDSAVDVVVLVTGGMF